MTTDLSIKKKALDVERTKLLVEALKNPVVELLLGYLVIEYAQRHGWMPQLAGTIAEGGVLTVVAYQQIAPLMPSILQGASVAGSSLLKALPALAAGA